MSEPPIVPDEDPGPVILGWNDAPVTGDRLDVNENSFIAGDPAGARIEIRSTGFHAFNGAGTETAHIDGAEGVFVGGEFRTSDALPGQVALSDDAYVTHLDGGGTFPGIKVVPIDTTNVELPAGIGPSVNGLTIFGGRNTAGGSSIVQCNPDASFMRTFRDDNRAAGEIQTSATESFMRTFRDGGGMGGEIQASPTESFIRTFGADGVSRGGVETAPTYSQMTTRAGDGVTRGVLYSDTSKAEMRVVKSDNYNSARITADGATITLFAEQNGQRYLKINETGIWIESGGNSYNLEETAQDSGWQSITPDAGYTGSASFAWRNKGGVIWYRGTVTATWAEGWNTIATLPAEVRPEYAYTVDEAGTSAGVLIRVQVDGRLELYAPEAGTSTHRFTSLSYPIG